MKPTSESSAEPIRGYLGYNFSSAVAGNFVPQRVQNLCIRDYASSKGLVLSFSVSEYADASRSLMLFTQFEHATAFEGFVFYSLLMLPADAARRHEFYDRVSCLSKPVHFALEDLCLATADDCQTIERIYRISLDPRLDQTRELLVRLRKNP